MNATIDKMAMLMSTDWFLGKWELWGLNSTTEMRLNMQLKCREIVLKMLSGKTDYWEVSFADERLRETYDSFFGAVSACKLPSTDCEFLHKLASGSLVDNYQLSDISSLELLTQILITDPDSIYEVRIPTELRLKLERHFCNRDMSDVVAESENPRSIWDRRMRDSTLDIPARLADFVITVWEQTHLSKFFAQIGSETSRDEQSLIRSWYSAASIKIVGYELPISAFLEN